MKWLINFFLPSFLRNNWLNLHEVKCWKITFWSDFFLHHFIMQRRAPRHHRRMDNVKYGKFKKCSYPHSLTILKARTYIRKLDTNNNNKNNHLLVVYARLHEKKFETNCTMYGCDVIFLLNCGCWHSTRRRIFIYFLFFSKLSLSKRLMVKCWSIVHWAAVRSLLYCFFFFKWQV